MVQVAASKLDVLGRSCLARLRLSTHSLSTPGRKGLQFFRLLMVALRLALRLTLPGLVRKLMLNVALQGKHGKDFFLSLCTTSGASPKTVSSPFILRIPQTNVNGMNS
eukprot:1136838-Pelagomonas_calceolata.AAC.9